MDKDLETNAQKIDRLSQEHAEFKAKNKMLEGENEQLEKGLREINEAIKEQSQLSLLLLMEKYNLKSFDIFVHKNFYMSGP